MICRVGNQPTVSQDVEAMVCWMADDFKLAKKHAPCILFIDEIEAVSSRATGGSNHRWYTNIITALNEQLHGIFSREGVVVIAATNYPDRIDPALLRPGRLDTLIDRALEEHRAGRTRPL